MKASPSSFVWFNRAPLSKLCVRAQRLLISLEAARWHGVREMAGADLAPQQSLYAIKLLQDSGLLQNQTATDRLLSAADLAGFLSQQLASTTAALLLAGEPPTDKFEIDIPNTIPANPIPH